MQILFVCTGNTCRSSMAEALAKHYVDKYYKEKKDIIIRSAGLAALPGSPASCNAVQAMHEKGLDLSCHRATILDERLIQSSDFILTMTEGHKNNLRAYYPSAKRKVYTLAEYALNDPTGYDITDPFGQSLEVYQKSADRIEFLIEKALHKAMKKENS